jgi:hypothetical protein
MSNGLPGCDPLALAAVADRAPFAARRGVPGLRITQPLRRVRTMTDQQNVYGFTWGNVEVTRLSHLEGRGRTLEVAVSGRPRREGLQVYISEGGRSVRVWRDGRELS